MIQLRTVQQFSDANPAFSASSIRHLIFQHAPRNKNNPYSDHALQHAVIRIGRRVLIDEEPFLNALRGLNND
jgi:hypothetical protein